MNSSRIQKEEKKLFQKRKISEPITIEWLALEGSKLETNFTHKNIYLGQVVGRSKAGMCLTSNITYNFLNK